MRRLVVPVSQSEWADCGGPFSDLVPRFPVKEAGLSQEGATRSARMTSLTDPVFLFLLLLFFFFPEAILRAL